MDVHERVLQVALESFSHFGYKGTTMEQVARAAGVGKGTVYSLFDSKESLFQEILSRVIASMRSAVDEVLVPGAPFFTNLERGMRRVVRFRKEHEVLVKLALEVRQYGVGPARDGLLQVERSIVGFLKRYIEQGIAQGDVKPCNPELIAFILLRTYTAMVTDWENSHDPLSDDELVDVFHLVFAGGLAASEGGERPNERIGDSAE
ncbi:TetR/AcrR family transcriptional regulator [Alicyclobacillus acidiphilus]|uniref:TetR/AcrR family transcriptional regulator n=1 Tax=Alicyclobacillus acidiphilus TaxID=182455 RepID=UPI000B23C774|nr:TetR/AcrR family transcriptional regulator [Alicyclobacillus acidiphilus]